MPGPTEASPVDKSGRSIREMFAAVAPRYDLLNRLLSGFLDVVWRRRAARELSAAEGRRVLDLCCGTGDQARALHRQGARVAAAADFCLPMLTLARDKLSADRLEDRSDHGEPSRHGPAGTRAKGSTPSPSGTAPPPPLAAADALALPFPPGSFTAATVSFGLRNVADLDRSLAELTAALAPGGRLVVLEFAVPEPRWLRSLYLFYFRHLLPRIGALLSPRGSAYRYLPSSVLDFPQRGTFLERMEAAGLEDCGWEDLSAGIVCLYTGRKPS